MAADSYSFLDIAALPGVRGRFARGDALLLLSVELDEVLWANGPGAALFGFEEIDALLDAPAPLGATARRQIAATKGFPAIGADRGVAVRLQAGIGSRAVPFHASSVPLPDGLTGILLSVPAAQDAGSAERAISGIAQPGQAAAIVDGEGAIVAASPDFGGFGLTPELLRRLLAKASAEPDTPLKQAVRVGERVLPAGVAALEDGRSLVIVTEDDFFELPEDVMTDAEAAGDSDEADALAPDGGAPEDEEGKDERGVEILLDDDAEGWYFNGREESAADESQAPDQRLAATRALQPVRFSWRTDSEGRFASISPEFAAFAGLGFGAIVGQDFDAVAGKAGVADGQAIAGLLRGRDTWSGRTVLWPVAGGAVQVPVDLAALPTYSRSRSFEGFRGFGVARTGDAVLAPPAPDDAGANEDRQGSPDALPQEADPGSEPPPAGSTLQSESDRVVQLLSPTRGAAPNEADLSPDERDAFLEIGARLKGHESAAAPAPEMEGEPAADAADDSISAGSSDAPEQPDVSEAELLQTAPAVETRPAYETADAVPEQERVDGLAPARASNGDGEPSQDPGSVAETLREQTGADRLVAPAEGGLAVRSAEPIPDAEEHDAPPQGRDRDVGGPAPESPWHEAPNDAAALSDEAREELRQEADAVAGHHFVPEVEAPAQSDNADGLDARGPALEEAGATLEASTEEPQEDEAEAPGTAEQNQRDTAIGESAVDERPAAAEARDRADATPPPAGAAREHGQTDTSVLDRLPVPVLIHSGDLLHYANPEFLSLAGYPSLSAFAQAGGLGCLFTAPWERISGREDRTLRLRTGGGEEFPVEALLRTAPWHGTKALLLVLRRLEGMPPRETGEAAELGQRLTEMRAIIDTATDGVVLIAPDGTIRSISRPAEALFGLDSAEASGRPFGSLFALESQRVLADYLEGLAGDGVASVLNDGREVVGREAKGGSIPLFMTVGPLPERSGFCAVLRDITQWKRAEEELTQSRALAERASTHKTEFLARVSHEIRTPLNAIIGFSELMLDEKFGAVGSDRYRDYLRDINRSGAHVLDLVNDLLDISKIEAGQQDMSYEAVALNDALSEAVATMQPQANRERVIIRSSLASRLPDVVADERSVRQIALNILSNAVRFTQAGGQVIVSTAYDSSGDVVMRVRDTGIGMSQAEIEQALKPFKQINSLKRTRGDGTGLGLPLTKAMVEANRARFAISSDPGVGTMVEVTFPATRVLAS